MPEENVLDAEALDNVELERFNCGWCSARKREVVVSISRRLLPALPVLLPVLIGFSKGSCLFSCLVGGTDVTVSASTSRFWLLVS